VIFLKFRVDPRSVYMRWIGVEKRGQELLWRPDWNEGRIHVHPGGVRLLCRRESRSSGREGDRLKPASRDGSWISAICSASFERMWGYFGEKSAKRLAPLPLSGGWRGRCIILELPKWKNADLYCYRTEFCFQKEDVASEAGSELDFEDGDQRLVEDYMYEDLRENPEFSDADFSPENPAYDFPGNSPSRRAW
jgi:hypothetical protein